MAKKKKTFWQRFKWWLYALQWFFTAIGIYQVVQWMLIPENRKNALIGAVIVLGFLLFGAIAMWRRKSAKKSAGKGRSSTQQRQGQNSQPEQRSGGEAEKSGYQVDTSTSEGSEEDRMKAIEEELSQN